MPFSAIREVIRVHAKTELGKGEEAVRRVLTECVMLSRGRDAIVEVTIQGIDMRIYSSSLHWSEDPRREAGRWMEEYLSKLFREMERTASSSLPIASGPYINAPPG